MAELKTLPDLVTLTTERFGDRVFQLRAGIGDAEHLSFKEFGERVQALATGLVDLGVAPGDTVGLIAHNRPECSASIVNCQPDRPLIRDGPFYPMTFVRRNRQVISGPKFNSIRPVLDADACNAFSAPPSPPHRVS